VTVPENREATTELDAALMFNAEKDGGFFWRGVSPKIPTKF
jgi:hypothetical protein